MLVFNVSLNFKDEYLENGRNRARVTIDPNSTRCKLSNPIGFRISLDKLEQFLLFFQNYVSIFKGATSGPHSFRAKTYRNLGHRFNKSMNFDCAEAQP